MFYSEIKIWVDVDCSVEHCYDFDSTLETYLISGKKKRGAVLICPGGGYKVLTQREGEIIALHFAANGYHSFVLNYSVSPKNYMQPVLDLSRALCILRENAENWNIISNNIAVCGFSAGAHLAASLGVHWYKEFLNYYVCEIGNNRPDALILSYPVITMKEYRHNSSREFLMGDRPSVDKIAKMSLEEQVTDKTPPTFLWHTVEDELVPVENSMMFASSLRKSGVPFEMHLFSEGAHGLSMANEETVAEGMKPDPHVANWFKLCIEWLERIF